MKAKLFLLILLSILLPYSASAAQEINLTFTQPAGAPYFIGTPELNIDAEEFNTLVLKIKSSKSGTGRLFWASNYDPQFNQPKSIWFFIKRSNYSKEYTFNVKSQNPNWVGFIGQILVYPENGTEGMEVKSAQAVPGNLITHIKSGWQEFWGPRGRLIIGSTINTIQSSNLFGRSIYVYIYWMIGLIILGYFGFESYKWSGLKKKPPFETVISNTGKAAFISVIVFWVLLEISSLFNNWITFKDDLKYFGKSYRDKLVLANTGDFYPFIEFCQNNLPVDARFDMRIPPVYNDIKARYYLYPRKHKKEAEYMVVYDLEIEKEIAGKYTIWKTFRGKAYIMRKR